MAGATPFSSSSLPVLGGVRAGGLLPAPAANRCLDMSPRGGSHSVPESKVGWGMFPTGESRLAVAYSVSMPKDITVRRGVMTLAVPEGRVCWGTAERCLTVSASDSTPKDFTGRRAVLAIAVPESKVGWGVFPTAESRLAVANSVSVSKDITVRRGVMTRAVPEGRVCWGFFPTAERHLAVAYSDSTPKDFTGGRGVLSLAVPEGTNSGWAGLLPAANRHVKVARCLSNSNESAVPLGKGSIWEPIPRAINASALVGHATILEDIAVSSRKIVSVINDFTPLLVDYVTNELLMDILPMATFSVFVGDKYQKMAIVPFIQRRAFDIVSAVELVEAEAKEGYVREETLLGAILKIRDPANRFLSKAHFGRVIELLPPPYAGIAPKEDDKVKHFLQMATELQGMAVALEAGLREVQS